MGRIIKELSKTPNLISQGFKYNETFADMENRVDKQIEDAKNILF